MAVLAIECATHIPAEYKVPVKGVSILPPGSNLGAIGAALDTQTSRLDIANSHTAGVVAVAVECDARNKKVIEVLTAKKKFWK